MLVFWRFQSSVSSMSRNTHFGWARLHGCYYSQLLWHIGAWNSPGGAGVCCAEQRKAHLPPVQQHTCQAGKPFAECCRWQTSTTSMFGPLLPGDISVLGSLMGSGQSRDQLGCCSLVPEQISRLSSSEILCGCFKPKYWPAASNVGGT